MRRPRIAALVVVSALVATACGAEELDGFLDALETADLSISADASERAAGETPIEILAAREAEEQLALGISELDPVDAARASALRPDDVRYPFYEAAILWAEAGGGDANKPAMQAAQIEGMARIIRQEDTFDQIDIQRIAMENQLLAVADVLRKRPEFEDRDKLVAEYCKGINTTYPGSFAERFPAETTAFLTLQADRSLCPSGS